MQDIYKTKKFDLIKFKSQFHEDFTFIRETSLVVRDELSVETGLWEYMRDFIEPETIVKTRKLKEQQAKKMEAQPKIDISKVKMTTGQRPQSLPLPYNSQIETLPQRALSYGGKKKTRRKQKRSKNKKSKKQKKMKKNRTKRKK